MALLFLDLNRFKAINDEFGHENANEILQAVAERLHSCIRAADTVGRYAGDEFVLILPDLKDADELARVLRRIRNAFCRPFALGEEELLLTSSIGVAFYPEDGEDASSLLRHADMMMYRVKERTINGYGAPIGYCALEHDWRFAAAPT
jgi:diguanylate cyclase (GGDEF)-like protein